MEVRLQRAMVRSSSPSSPENAWETEGYVVNVMVALRQLGTNPTRITLRDIWQLGFSLLWSHQVRISRCMYQALPENQWYINDAMALPEILSMHPIRSLSQAQGLRSGVWGIWELLWYLAISIQLSSGNVNWLLANHRAYSAIYDTEFNLSIFHLQQFPTHSHIAY